MFGFYTKPIQLNSSISEAYNQRAKLQLDLFNNLDSAIEDITKAIELLPQVGDYYYNRSFFYTNKGELQLFYNDLNKVIELNPMTKPLYSLEEIFYFKAITIMMQF